MKKQLASEASEDTQARRGPKAWGERCFLVERESTVASQSSEACVPSKAAQACRPLGSCRSSGSRKVCGSRGCCRCFEGSENLKETQRCNAPWVFEPPQTTTTTITAEAHPSHKEVEGKSSRNLARNNVVKLQGTTIEAKILKDLKLAKQEGFWWLLTPQTLKDLKDQSKTLK